MEPEDEDVDRTIEAAHGHRGTCSVQPLHCQQRGSGADSIIIDSMAASIMMPCRAPAPMPQTRRRYLCHKCATYAALH